MTKAGDPAGGDDPTADIEAYEADDRTVLYDARNPLAWIESSAAVIITEAA